MHPTVRSFVPFLLTAALLTTLTPADAFAQRRGGGGRVAVPAPAHRGYYRPGSYHRPYYGHYRPYYYRPYYRSYYGGYWPYYYAPYYWGAWSWYPYPYAVPYWGFGYGGYGWYDGGSAARLQVTPRETQVYVDGAFVGLVDDFDGFSQRLRLEPGEHEVVLYLPGHRLVRQKLLFRPGADVKIRFVMEKLAPGEPEPEKPSAAAPPPRESELRGELFDQSVPPPQEAAAGEGAPREDAAPAEGFGQLAVRVQPADAVVLIDGERWDAPAGRRLVVELAPGEHRLEVQRDGHVPYSTQVTLRAGETTTLNVSLPRR